jgi:hypothetical protein
VVTSEAAELAKYERRATRQARFGSACLALIITLSVASKMVGVRGLASTVLWASVGVCFGALLWFVHRPGTAWGKAIEAAARKRRGRSLRASIVNLDALVLWVVAFVSAAATGFNGTGALGIVSVVTGYASATASFLIAPVDGKLAREAHELDLEEIANAGRKPDVTHPK